MKCGHDEPSKESNAFKAKSPYPYTKEFTLVLKNIKDAELIDGKSNKVSKLKAERCLDNGLRRRV